MPASNVTPSDSLSALVVSQVNFGLAYVREARAAYDQGRYEYGDLARQIAQNAYSTANRFVARLSGQESASMMGDVRQFKDELDALLAEPVPVRSIA